MVEVDTPWPVRWISMEEAREMFGEPTAEERTAAELQDIMRYGTVIYQGNKHVPYELFCSPSIVRMIEADRAPVGPGNLKLSVCCVRSAWGIK